MICRSRAAGVVLVTGVAVTLTVAACSAAATTHATTVAASIPALATKYLAIANPSNKNLDHDFDLLADHHHSDLAASQQDLRTIAAVERAFDRDLRALRFPAAYSVTAAALVRMNEARANLTSQAATASSLAVLHTYETELTAMNARVEDQVRTLRKQLHLPPPSTS
jgi:hypothetical protein